jgi:putative membrane protein
MDHKVRVALVVVGALHIAFATAEATVWTWATVKAGIYSPDQAAQTADVAKNMAIYNAILAAWCFWLLRRSSELSSRGVVSLGTLLLGSVAVAGLVGALTMKHWPIFAIQSGPAILALYLLRRHRNG